MKKGRWLILMAVFAMVVAACSSGTTGGGEGTSCAKGDLRLVTPGVLTIGTDDPAFPPWFEENDPSNGKGFESAVAYAVADELGFSPTEVTWVVVPFNNSYQPGEKNFDFDINQISITPERAQVVDFSDGYYNVNQALVAFDTSPAAGAKAMADVKKLKLGAQIGTTSLQYIENVIKPDTDPYVYDTNNDAKLAMEAGQIDGIVVDLPTAFYISAVEIEGSSVVGQFPSVGDNPEQFGMLFQKDNPLRACVNEALQRLKDNGKLAGIEKQWLSDATGAPVITP